MNESMLVQATQTPEKTSQLSAPARTVGNSFTAAPTDFHLAADLTMPAVVHIKSIRTNVRTISDPFYELFGGRPQQRDNRKALSSGSGVIIGQDGYIVTNNHVIKDADELEVTLYDNRTFKATVIGTDPSTDLGLIKIEAEDLQTIELANSDEVRVGEWVLAVGNPFSLASTATAGIVSAIGRDLEIIKDQMAIESFIQTDAAVNPGNSGGALVNVEGQLIGVNTAIASPTGAYAGYAFAVPANIVSKVVRDLREFGGVQRAFLGISYAANLNSEVAAKNGLKLTEGVLVERIAPEGGAAKAGIKAGDVIVQIDGIKVRNDAKLLELVGRNRPGEAIDVEIYRNEQYKSLQVTLTDEYGKTEVRSISRDPLLSDLGLELTDLAPEQLSRFGVENGVLVSKLTAGKLRSQTKMRENFVILEVNQRSVESRDSLIRTLGQSRGEVTLTGFYPGYRRVYSYAFRR